MVLASIFPGTEALSNDEAEIGSAHKAGWAEPLQTSAEVFPFLVGLSLCKSIN